MTLLLGWIGRPLFIIAAFVLARLAEHFVIICFAFYDLLRNYVPPPPRSDDALSTSAYLRWEPAGDWIADPLWAIYALIIIAEFARVRRSWLYVVCGAVAIGLTPWLFILRPGVGSVVGSVYGLNCLQYAAAGGIGGLVYWLVAVKWGGNIKWSWQR
jgi:hypothetical protein